jgi:hypothetical protein
MSKASAIHRIAQQDTPQMVDVPDTWSGLIVWALGRFGGIVVATAFLAYAWHDGNESHKKQTERLITLLENKARTDTELATALKGLSVAIDEVAKDAKQAHFRP